MGSVQQLAANPYTGGSSPTKGIVVNDYQSNMLEPHSDRPRWWKAFKAADGTVGPNNERPERNGLLYIEQSLDPDAFVYIEQTVKEVYDVEFGLLSKGQTQVACNPAYIELARGDRVALPSRLSIGRIAVTPSADGNSLERKYVTEITSVYVSGEVVPATPPDMANPEGIPESITPATLLDVDAYSLIEDDDGTSRIEWADNATYTLPTATALIEFRYNPLYVFLDVSDRNPGRGADGERLLQRGVLTLEQKLD